MSSRERERERERRLWRQSISRWNREWSCIWLPRRRVDRTRRRVKDKKLGAWALACRDLACRVFECMIVLPWFTQYHFVFECSSAWLFAGEPAVIYVRVHDCPAVIYPVPFRVRVFECRDKKLGAWARVRVFECRDKKLGAWALEPAAFAFAGEPAVRWWACRDLPSTISRRPNASTRSEPVECSSAWLFAACRVFECMIVRWWARVKDKKPAVRWWACRDLPSTISRRPNASTRSEPVECSSAWLFAACRVFECMIVRWWARVKDKKLGAWALEQQEQISKKGIKLILKTIGNRKGDCAWSCSRWQTQPE